MLYFSNQTLSAQTLKRGNVINIQVATLFFTMLLLFAFTGCSTIERTKVEFINPYTLIPVTRVEPDALEKKGMLLHFKRQPKPVIYKDIVQIFTQIDEGTAISVDVRKSRKVSSSAGNSENSFLLTTETNTSKSDLRQGIEVVEMDSTGKILKFIKGEFTTKHGKMTFLSHKRSAMFPEKPLIVGDKWSYDEHLEMKFESTLVSRKSEKPDDIKVECQLTGFAVVDGYRCAIISTRAITKRIEHYSTLWKDMTFNVNIYINEILYFDYRRGVLVGSITKTDSYSTSEKLDFSDISRSQSISILEKKRK